MKSTRHPVKNGRGVFRNARSPPPPSRALSRYLSLARSLARSVLTAPNNSSISSSSSSRSSRRQVTAAHMNQTMPPMPVYNVTVPEPPYYVIVYVSVAYALLFTLGILGNALVVAVVCRQTDMRTTTNCFIVNLSIADILVIGVSLLPLIVNYRVLLYADFRDNTSKEVTLTNFRAK